MAQTAEPIIFARLGDGSEPARRQEAHRLRVMSMSLYGAIVAAVFVAAFLFHAPLFHWLLAPAYWSVSPLLPWMALAAGIFGVAQLQSVTWLINLDPKRMEIPRIGSAVIGIALVWAGAGFNGILGVVAAQVAYSIVLFVWMGRLR
jgi:O-antigen/teichoic acid export membrane protein